MKITQKSLGVVFLLFILPTLVSGGSVTLDHGTNSLVAYDDMSNLTADRTLTLNWSNNFTGYDGGNSTADVVIAIYVPVDYGVISTNNVTINDNTNFQKYNVSAGNCTELNAEANKTVWHTNCTLITINGTLQNPTGGFNLTINITISDSCANTACVNKTYELMFSDMITYKKLVNNAVCDVSTYNNTGKGETYCYVNGSEVGVTGVNYSYCSVPSNRCYRCAVTGQTSGNVSCNITKGIGSMYNTTELMEQGTTGKLVMVPYVTYNIELVVGWNLISLPVIPNNLSIDNVLSNVDYDTLWRWNAINDNWESYKKSTSKGDFYTFEPDRGHWINVNTSTNLTITGNSGGTRNVGLVADWNLIGYTSRETKSIVEILQLVGYDTLWRWNAINDNWESYKKSTSKGNFYNMTPGRGFWINVNTPGNLAYPGI